MNDLHTGGCHCGAVRFQVRDLDLANGLYRCNCSLCLKKGIVMRAVDHSDFTLIAGDSDLICYQWNKHIARHYFCKHCGVYTHHRRRRNPEQICINAACIDGFVYPDEASLSWADGRSHD